MAKSKVAILKTSPATVLRDYHSVMNLAGYQDVVVAATRAGDWSGFADMFTEDASYVEHAFGRFSGREEIRGWVTRTMGSFPGNTMTSFPVGWYVVDEDRGWVVCEIRNLMPDPGDGSSHEASNLTVLHYGGDGLWNATAMCQANETTNPYLGVGQ